MADLNSCSFTGRLGRDPERRVSPNGTVVTNFSIAVSAWNRDGEQTLWMDCSTFGKSAENAAQYLRKGSIVGVSGSLQPRDYQDRDGIKRRSFSLTVNSFSMIGPRQDSQRQDSSPTAQSANTQNAPVDKPDFDDDIPW